MAESRTEDLEADEAQAAPEGNTGYHDEWSRLREEERGLLPNDGGRDELPGDDADTTDEDEPGGQDRGASEDPPEDDAADQPGPAAEETADIWANVDPKLREAFEAEKAARERAENHNRTQGSRLSQASRRLNDLETIVAASRAKDAEAPKEGDDGKSREERMAALREEYPEVAGPLLDEIDQLRQTVNALSGDAVSERTARTESFLDEQERLLEEKHPGWLDETKKPEWAEWVSKQPAYVMDGLQRNANRIVDAVEAADLFDRFKAESGKGPGDGKQDEIRERRQQQLEGGRTGTVRTPSTAASQGGTYEAEWARLRDKERREERARQVR